MKHAFYLLALLFVVNVSFAQNVEIQGQLKLVNGTEGEGKVLVSDEDGVASWVTKTDLIIDLHKDLIGGLVRLINWGISPVTLWEAGVPYDSLIGLNIDIDLNNGLNELIFFVDTLDIYPFSVLTTGRDGFTYGPWGSSGAITGADGILLGEGSQNSTDVRNQCPAPPNGNIVFWQITNAGPSWSIASTEEAQMIYDLLISPGIYDPIGGPINEYWTSSEAQGANEATHAMMIDKTTGVIAERIKTVVSRAFTVRQIPD
ncbi:MAG TPA: hypothetical protein VK169_15105 [Saprospiraceae bacterium]|nr:hypothetical protein [Saprospiraceae bacterium]